MTEAATASADTWLSRVAPASGTSRLEILPYHREAPSVDSSSLDSPVGEILPYRSPEEAIDPCFFNTAFVPPTVYIIDHYRPNSYWNQQSNSWRPQNQRRRRRYPQFNPYVNDCINPRNLANAELDSTDNSYTKASSSYALTTAFDESSSFVSLQTSTSCNRNGGDSIHKTLQYLPRCHKLYKNRALDSNMRTYPLFETEVNDLLSLQIWPTLEAKSHLLSLERTHLRKMCVLNGSSPSAYAQMAANRVIKHARDHKVLAEKKLWCLNCDRIPIQPVTSQCGHTRCTKCTMYNGDCPCGGIAPDKLCVNVATQQLIERMFNGCNTRDMRAALDRGVLDCGVLPPVRSSKVAATKTRNSLVAYSRMQRRSPTESAAFPMSARTGRLAVSPRTPMTPQVRFKYARSLIENGQLKEAATHLARVAASPDKMSKIARVLLAQTIDALSEGKDPRRLIRELNRMTRAQSATSWLRTSDLECPLCYNVYIKPVTTPCGHTYCRTCLERLLDYSKYCALCVSKLDEFDLLSTADTIFISAALEAIDARCPPPPLEPDVIPILVCTVAFPSIPCPLFMFDPRYWIMVRRILDSGSRKFGMLAHEKYRNDADYYGTVLEVCDCVLLEDGSFILSTVGLSRFKVIEKHVWDGCDVARIEPLVDKLPSEDLAIWKIRNMAWITSYKAQVWLNTVNEAVRESIEAAFGELPSYFGTDESWLQSPDGPAWLWWFIAILPLKPEIKVLILSTKCLLKRLMAVSRTFDVMEHMTKNYTMRWGCE
ncbi:unnamed protein product [Parnassius apollo]|uniref:(apollo) hypothetical protein n=1 Tax=Parnassius apollo TaxID=110799 RepID=A0A8S3VZQ7_PARAO|nr:unnamed protein product [Parnassius apollo]